MSAETAEILFFVITGVMGLVWLTATRFAFSRLRTRDRYEEYEDRRDDEYDGEAIHGEVVVEGTREALSKKIAEQLAASSSVTGTFFLKITECTKDRVAFERTRGAPGRHAQCAFRFGVILLKSEGNQVRLRYVIPIQRFLRIMKLVTYLVCFVYGGIFVFGTPILIWHLVVQSDDPKLRWQVLQTLQMVHGVWPPFLIGSVTGRLKGATAAYFDTLLQNLAHTA